MKKRAKLIAIGSKILIFVIKLKFKSWLKNKIKLRGIDKIEGTKSKDDI